MPAGMFIARNAPMNTTAAPVFQSTAATVTVRTMLQIAAPATSPQMRVVAWGYDLLTIPAAPPTLELIETGTVFATGLTAHVAAGVQPWNVPTGAASAVQLGTALTGYTASAPATLEGTIAATRLFDCKVEPGQYFLRESSLSREPEIPVGRCLRIRATPGSAALVNILCWVLWEE